MAELMTKEGLVVGLIVPPKKVEVDPVEVKEVKEVKLKRGRLGNTTRG